VHDRAHQTAESKDAVIERHAAELRRWAFLAVQANAGVTAAGQELRLCMMSLMETMEGWR
jgi:hypothetical protein